MKFLSNLSIAVALGAFGVSVAAAESTPRDPQYIMYTNMGAYVVEYVNVKWKDGDKTNNHRFTKNLQTFGHFCADLSQVKSSDGDAIPLGAEVWLEVKIKDGPTKNCRKESKHYYQLSGNTWKLETKHAVQSGNRCKNASTSSTGEVFESGNSKSC